MSLSGPVRHLPPRSSLSFRAGRECEIEKDRADATLTTQTQTTGTDLFNAKIKLSRLMVALVSRKLCAAFLQKTAEDLQSPYHEYKRCQINRTQMTHPVIGKMTEVMHRQSNGQARHGGNHGRPPRPPFSFADSPPREGCNSYTCSGNKPGRCDVQMINVVNHRRVKGIELLF